MADALLTTGEVAQRFQVTSSAIRHWVAQGWIPFLRLPSGQLRFRLTEVERAVAAMETASQAARTRGGAA